MDLSEIWFRHNRTILIAASCVAAVVLVVGGAVLLYRLTVTPEVPDPVSAEPEKVVEFIASEGMGRLSRNAQREYLEKVITEFRPRERRKEFIWKVNQLSDMQVEQLQDNVMRVAVDQTIEDAQAYDELRTETGREKFIEQKLGEWEKFQDVIRGRDLPKQDGKAVDMAGSKLARGIPSTPSGVYQKFLQKTNPGQRAKLERYVNDVQKVAERNKEREKYTRR